jgi:hypothetical protein
METYLDIYVKIMMTRAEMEVTVVTTFFFFDVNNIIRSRFASNLTKPMLELERLSLVSLEAYH